MIDFSKLLGVFSGLAGGAFTVAGALIVFSSNEVFQTSDRIMGGFLMLFGIGLAIIGWLLHQDDLEDAIPNEVEIDNDLFIYVGKHPKEYVIKVVNSGVTTIVFRGGLTVKQLSTIMKELPERVRYLYRTRKGLLEMRGALDSILRKEENKNALTTLFGISKITDKA